MLLEATDIQFAQLASKMCLSNVEDSTHNYCAGGRCHLKLREIIICTVFTILSLVTNKLPSYSN